MLYFSPLAVAVSTLFIQVAFSLPQIDANPLGDPVHGGQIGGGRCHLKPNCCGGCFGDPSLGQQLTFSCDVTQVSAFSSASCIFAVSILNIVSHSPPHPGLYVVAPGQHQGSHRAL